MGFRPYCFNTSFQGTIFAMNTNELEPVSEWNEAAQISENEIRSSRHSGGTLSPRAERMMLMSHAMLDRKRTIELRDSDWSLSNDLKSRYY